MKKIINKNEIIAEAKTLRLGTCIYDPLDMQLVYVSQQGHEVIVGTCDSPKHLLKTFALTMICNRFTNLTLLERIKYKVKKFFNKKCLFEYSREIFEYICDAFEKNEDGIADFLEGLMLSARLSCGDAQTIDFV